MIESFFRSSSLTVPFLLKLLFFTSVSATLLPFHPNMNLDSGIDGAFSHMDLHGTAGAGSEASNYCDIFNGRWVFDETYPLYSGGSCPFISSRVNCKLNGRPDSDYLKWRWQPSSCILPRFDGIRLLQSLSGKRVMIVGDSLDRGMWESLVCMFHRDLPDLAKYVEIKYSFNVFRAPEYNASIEFFWAPFLVDLDTAIVNGIPKRILKVNSIQNAEAWRDVDILVFNSANYWTHFGNLRIWDYVEYENTMYQELDRMFMYKIAMQTWANWVDSNLNPGKTRIFFRSISPMHFDAMQWDKPGGHRCANEREPITNDSYLSPFPPQMLIIEGILEQMRYPVYYLNITRLSDYRKDGHPSFYTFPAATASCDNCALDCSHWCVPGLPDTWNEFLYYYLL